MLSGLFMMGAQGEEELWDLFENAPCGYISVDACGRILLTNRTLTDWLGIGAGEAAGRRFIDYLSVPSKIFFQTHFDPLIRMQESFNEVALDMITAKGTELPVLVNAVVRRNGSGDLACIRITIFNATERRCHERELLVAHAEARQAIGELKALNATLESRVATAAQERTAAEAALGYAMKMEAFGHLAGGIVHDFKNMLTVVISGLSVLQHRIVKQDLRDVDKLVAATMDGANRAAKLTQRLLALSRQQPSPESLDVNGLITCVLELVGSVLNGRIDIQATLADRIGTVMVDASQFESALLNLIVNARDAMPDGGKISVITSEIDIQEGLYPGVKQGCYVSVAVADTGVGMPPDVVARAFDPFFTTKDVGKGTGLGLSQVFGFAKQSGGHVEIASKSQHGATITILLPVSAKGSIREID
ncbi:ATP-binding protein [Azospirillum sp. A29]|uniref:ATP-binding protein n=1 Tax=unclassified Azospirillum TaxID=2630922 RepID=UPI0036732F1A